MMNYYQNMLNKQNCIVNIIGSMYFRNILKYKYLHMLNWFNLKIKEINNLNIKMQLQNMSNSFDCITNINKLTSNIVLNYKLRRISLSKVNNINFKYMFHNLLLQVLYKLHKYYCITNKPFKHYRDKYLLDIIQLKYIKFNINNYLYKINNQWMQNYMYNNQNYTFHKLSLNKCLLTLPIYNMITLNYMYQHINH